MLNSRKLLPVELGIVDLHSSAAHAALSWCSCSRLGREGLNHVGRILPRFSGRLQATRFLQTAWMSGMDPKSRSSTKRVMDLRKFSGTTGSSQQYLPALAKPLILAANS